MGVCKSECMCSCVCLTRKCSLNITKVNLTHFSPFEPRGLSDCVEKALDVTLTTDSISESPKSPIKSLSGDSDALGRNRVSALVKSLSDRPE